MISTGDNMNIGIDIDGVLEDYGNYIRTHGAEYFQKRYHMSIVNPAGYSAEEVFGCTRKQSKAFWFRNARRYWTTEPAIKGSAEVIGKLSGEGHIIHLITGRAFTADKGPQRWISRGLLRRWLRQNGIIYDEIVFCPQKEPAPEKLAACKRHRIDTMVDDDPENIATLKDSLHMIVFDSPWNKRVGDENLYRAHSWQEVYDIVHQIEKDASSDPHQSSE